jgi:hypothetical protein
MTTPATSQAPGYVRTGTPMALGSVIMWLASRIFGISLSASDVLTILPIIQAAYYVVGRALERWKPSLGYILGIAKQPVYSAEKAPSPGEGEGLQAVVVPEQDEDGLPAVPVPEPTDNGPRPEDPDVEEPQDPNYIPPSVDINPDTEEVEG